MFAVNDAETVAAKTAGTWHESRQGHPALLANHSVLCSPGLTLIQG